MAENDSGSAVAAAAGASNDKEWDNNNNKDALDDDADEARSKVENFKYYTSLILGTLCLVCVFAFLFLVPFVLDPAISTLMHEFVDVPVTCKANSVSVKHGKGNCFWSSCREGCTADMYICFQVRVMYSKQPWEEGTMVHHISDWVDLTRYDKKEKGVMVDTPLLINIKGCGYPPDIDCRAFTTKYDNISEGGDTFPCYYSRVNPWIVLEVYSHADALWDVVASIAIPNGLFLLSLIVLLYWYCPYCQSRYRKYEVEEDKEQKEGVMMVLEAENDRDVGGRDYQ